MKSCDLLGMAWWTPSQQQQWSPVQGWVHQHSFVDKDRTREAQPVSGELEAVVAQELPTGAHKQARVGRVLMGRGLVGRKRLRG